MVAYLKSGPEWTVNTTTVANQFSSRIVTLANGGYVIVWQDNSHTGGDISGSAVRGQIFSATGTKVGSEFLVNTATFDLQFSADVAALPNGGFVVSWTDTSGVGGDADTSAVKAQLFGAAGAKVGGEFRVNSTTAAAQDRSHVAVLSDGTFFVVWVDASGTGGDPNHSIKGQHFAANGTTIGSEFLVNVGQTADEQTEVAVAALIGGGFAVAWRDDPDQISFRRFDANGNVDGALATISVGPGAAFLSLDVTGLAGGGFAIAYLDGNSFETRTAKALVVDPFGTITPVTLASPTPGMDSNPVVAAMPDGGFIAVWDDLAAQPDGDIRAAVFDAFGHEITRYSLLGVPGTTSLSSTGFIHDVTVLPNGDVIISFGVQTGSETTGSDVWTQRFAAYQERAGTDANNFIVGGAGHDFILGRDGSDTLKGNAGDDILDGGLNSDSLDGGLGIDAASYGSAAAGVIADLAITANNSNSAFGDIYIGIENVIGSKFADKLSGNAAANVLYGDAGDDELIGRGGADRLVGEAGNDTASYIFSTAGVAADLRSGGTLGDAKGDRFISVENLTGSNFNDVLIGTEFLESNVLRGMAGNDVLEGLSGADTLDGGLGVNTASYARAKAAVGADLIAIDFCFGDGEGDIYISIQNLTGSSFDDYLGGDGDANVLNGGDGNDELVGRGGADTFNGGNGIDTARFTLASAAVHVDLTTPGNNTGDAAGDIYNSIENIIGTHLDDVLRGNALNNVLEGGAGADKLDGIGGIDTADYGDTPASVTASLTTPANNKGAAQGDTYFSIENLTGAASNPNSLEGNNLANVLVGGSADDVLSGLGGNDRLLGNSGKDTSSGGTGDDLLDAGNGDDLLNGDDGNDKLLGGLGNDLLNGGNGNDILEAGDGNDTLDGGANNDTLRGGVGNDSLFGGSGNDVLIGEAATDTLTGQQGKDIFVFESAGDAPDHVNDFISIDDTLRFDASNFGGGLVAGALAAVRLVSSTAPVANKAFGQFLYDTDDETLSWDADGTGGGAAVLIATLFGTSFNGGLTAADFQIVA